MAKSLSSPCGYLYTEFISGMSSKQQLLNDHAISMACRQPATRLYVRTGNSSAVWGRYCAVRSRCYIRTWWAEWLVNDTRLFPSCGDRESEIRGPAWAGPGGQGLPGRPFSVLSDEGGERLNELSGSLVYGQKSHSWGLRPPDLISSQRPPIALGARISTHEFSGDTSVHHRGAVSWLKCLPKGNDVLPRFPQWTAP